MIKDTIDYFRKQRNAAKRNLVNATLKGNEPECAGLRSKIHHYNTAIQALVVVDAMQQEGQADVN